MNAAIPVPVTAMLSAIILQGVLHVLAWKDIVEMGPNARVVMHFLVMFLTVKTDHFLKLKKTNRNNQWHNEEGNTWASALLLPSHKESLTKIQPFKCVLDLTSK